MNDVTLREPGSKPNVYFIDDSATMREVVKIAFRRENFNVVTCSDMASAVAQFDADGSRCRHQRCHHAGQGWIPAL